MTGLIKKSQAGKRGMEGGKGLALFHRKRTKAVVVMLASVDLVDKYPISN